MMAAMAIDQHAAHAHLAEGDLDRPAIGIPVQLAPAPMRLFALRVELRDDAEISALSPQFQTVRLSLREIAKYGKRGPA